MKTSDSNPNVPQPPPKGYKLKIHGIVAAGDLLWTPETKSYEVAGEDSLETPRTCWKAVAVKVEQ
jgi:hypothetical protein